MDLHSHRLKKVEEDKVTTVPFGTTSRTVLAARDPHYVSKDKMMIDLFVVFREIPGELAFSACPWDTEPHGRQLFDMAKSGVFGPVKDPAPDAPDHAPGKPAGF
jgi:hypothetical protein